MERRREARFTVEQAVKITVLGEVEQQLTATVKDVSGRGLRLHSPVEVAVGSSIKIALADAMALGESVYCRLEGDHYAVGVQLEEILSGLLRLATAVEEETAAEPARGSKQPQSAEN